MIINNKITVEIYVCKEINILALLQGATMDIVSAKKVFNKMAIPQFSSISVKNDFEILVKESNLSYVAVLLQKY